MAVAISPSSISAESRSKTSAAGWTSRAAGIASLITIPLAIMVAIPLSKLMFVRGSELDGDWLRVAIVVMIPLSIAGYAIFCALTSDLLKNKVSRQVRTHTLKVAGLGALPYVLIAGAGYLTSTLTLMVLGMLTVPFAVAATIWASSKAV